VSDRCGFGQGTFVGTRGNDEVAPISAVREAAMNGEVRLGKVVVVRAEF
jgi:purine nucleoside permease